MCICDPAASGKALCPPHSICPYSICLFVHSSEQTLLSRCLMNALNNFDKTDRKYSLAPTDDRFWRSKVKVTAGHQGGEGSTSMLGRRTLSSSFLVVVSLWKDTSLKRSIMCRMEFHTLLTCSLPTNVIAWTSLPSFKRQLKTFLFTKSFPSL